MNEAQREALRESGGRCQNRINGRRCAAFFGQSTMFGEGKTQPVFKPKGYSARGKFVALCPECAKTYTPPTPPSRRDNFMSDGARAHIEALNREED